MGVLDSGQNPEKRKPQTCIHIRLEKGLLSFFSNQWLFLVSNCVTSQIAIFTSPEILVKTKPPHKYPYLSKVEIRTNNLKL